MTRWLIAASLIVIVLYLPHVLGGGWVYEDAALLQGVAAPTSLWRPRALSQSLWWLQWQASPDPRLFHAVSVGLHLIVVGLTAVLVRRLGVSAAGATLAVIVIALHPLTVETVAYAAQQGELLAAIGVLTACILATGRWWRAPVWGGILVAVAFGMLGKESAVVALALVPLLIGARAAQAWASWLPALLVAVGVGGGLVAWYGGWQSVANLGEAPGVHVDALDWLLVQSAAAMRMLGLLVVPIGPFTVDYDYDAVHVAVRGVALFSVVGLCVAAMAIWNRWRLGVLGLAWMLIVIAPRLFIQTPRSIFNEHQAYLMVPGFALLVGAAWDRWADKAGHVLSHRAAALSGRQVQEPHA